MARASSTECACPLFGTDSPTFSHASLKRPRSSALRMASRARADQLDAVLGEHAGIVERQRQVERRLPAEGGQHRIGLLALDDLGEASTVRGSTYVASANSGSVMIVAGFELTRITS